MDKTNLKSIKENIENTSKRIKSNVESTSKKIDSMMNNRFFLAVFMIIDGICFIINPTDKMEFTAIFVGVCIILASCGVLITNIKSKYKDIKSIIIASVMIILSVFIIMNPTILVMNIRIILALLIILNGLINILNTLKIDKISMHLSNTEKKIKNDFEKYEKELDLNKDSVMREVEKVANPLNSFIEKVSNISILYFILNGISIILGLFLFSADNITLVICGVILIYTGLSDLLILAKSIGLSNKLKKIKERYKQILR